MSKNTNVLYICPNGYLGGAERAVIDFCSGHLDSKNINAKILFFNAGMATQESIKLGNTTIILKQKFKLSSPINLIKALIEIRKIVISNDIKVIHSTMPYSHIVLSLALLLKPGIKKVWFQHGPVGGLLDKISSLFPVDVILYNSSYTKEQHLKTAFKTNSKTKHEIINLPIVQKFDEHNVSESFVSPFTFIQLGRITSWKANHLAILAISQMSLKNIVPKIKLLIIGSAQRESDIQYFEFLKNLVQSLQLENYVDFVPNTPHPQSFMKKAFALLHTSTTLEPFGLVAAEAMLNHCFVIGSSEGGIRDILIDGKTGYNFNPNLPDSHLELSSQMLKLIQNYNSNPQSIELIKDEAFKHITKNYNLSDTTKHLESIYLSF